MERLPPATEATDPAARTSSSSTLRDRLKGRGVGLLAEISAGNMEAVGELYDIVGRDLHALALWRTGSSDDAQDVVQDVFAKLAVLGGRLLEIRDPASWLLRVTHRAAVDVVRRHARRREDPGEAALLLVAPASDPDLQMDARRVSTLLVALPAKQREVIYLRHVAELSFRQIGDAIGASTFTAASRYRLGLRALRRRLGEDR